MNLTLLMKNKHVQGRILALIISHFHVVSSCTVAASLLLHIVLQMQARRFIYFKIKLQRTFYSPTGPLSPVLFFRRRWTAWPVLFYNSDAVGSSTSSWLCRTCSCLGLCCSLTWHVVFSSWCQLDFNMIWPGPALVLWSSSVFSFSVDFNYVTKKSKMFVNLT